MQGQSNADGHTSTSGKLSLPFQILFPSLRFALSLAATVAFQNSDRELQTARAGSQTARS